MSFGINTARFLGKEKKDSIKNEEILKRMKNIPYEKRKAKFTSVIALKKPDEETIFFEGTVEGYISEEQKGKGFGMDPIFIIPKYEKTFGELGIKIKNEISHRAVALKKLKEYMKKG